MTIDDGAALHTARKALGLSVNQLADRLRLSGANGGDAVREMESGKRPISGPVSVAVEGLLIVEGMTARKAELELEQRTVSLTDREAEELYWLGRFLARDFGEPIG